MSNFEQMKNAGFFVYSIEIPGMTGIISTSDAFPIVLPNQQPRIWRVPEYAVQTQVTYCYISMCQNYLPVNMHCIKSCEHLMTTHNSTGNNTCASIFSAQCLFVKRRLSFSDT